MILTRFVKIQLAIFLIATLIGITVMMFRYLQVPTLLGVGKMTVVMHLPKAGGLYRFGNVTYRGVQVGKVTAVELNPSDVTATLTISSSAEIPVNLEAEVRSVSAVGEQYVDLRPREDAAPYLHDGSVITAQSVQLPQDVGPMLKRLSALIDTVPKDQLSVVLDEGFEAFNGSGDDLGTLLSSSSTISSAMQDSADQGQTLVEESGPLLETQTTSAQQIRQWAKSLAAVTGQVRTDDAQLRKVIQTAPTLADDATSLLNEWKPTIPVLLANLVSVGQVGMIYNASLETVLVVLPPLIAQVQSFGPANNDAGLTPAAFKLLSADPPPCTVGFLPPSQWRSPSDTSVVDLPDGVYCKLPQNSPIAVRGIRNMPCMGVPGKRAPTVRMCYSNEEYQPLAERQPALGVAVPDPNLLDKGVPPENPDVRPGVQGYQPPPEPLPEDAAPPSAPAEPAPSVPAPQPADPAATHPSSVGPGLQVTHYDPRTGEYLGPDGRLYRQADLVVNGRPKTWKDLLPH